MSPASACAVIVTYHPSPAMVAHLAAARTQVQGMVVVDNGSRPEEVASLRQAASELGFQLIENGENLGIAEALNRGVAWAKAKGFSWVILFDQDSRITEGFLDTMFETWEVHPHREKIASLHPRHVEPGTHVEGTIKRAPDGGTYCLHDLGCTDARMDLRPDRILCLGILHRRGRHGILSAHKSRGAISSPTLGMLFLFTR